MQFRWQRHALLLALVGLGAGALLAATPGGAARAERAVPPEAPLAPAVLADIGDVFTWMDGTRLNLAMTVSGTDEDVLNPSVMYVFHVHSKPGIGVAIPGTGPGTETRVICRFASNVSGQCWVTEPADGNRIKDYVAGDPSNTAGVTSRSQRVRFFAGRRSNPAFFNLQGFREAAKRARLASSSFVRDAAGCPANVSGTGAQAIATALDDAIPVGEAPCPGNQRDCFAEANAKVILVQLERSLVNAGSQTAVGVWASTHAGS